MKYIAILFASALMGCNGCSEQKPAAEVNYEQIQKDLIQARKAEHGAEMKKIHEFIEQKQWPMIQTPTGVHYWIYEQGGGVKAQMDNIVTMDYSIHLLDGTLCYKTDDFAHAAVLIGMDNVESGIHEVLLYMREGDRARVILPSHMAFGYTGDSNKIPQNASLLYDLKILEVR
jgi:FKBP-type peptidyl-prolyl cis-trans isomerase